MTLDDRERNFEKAMARELRADAQNGLHCPDAETLAAYHERLLSPEEMVEQKSHIAACARCQEILSTLELTEVVSNEAELEESVVAAATPKALRAVVAAPVFSQREGAAAGGSKVREMPKPKPYLRWAVPAGAVAAGLLVWVAINASWNERKAQMSKAASAPVEVAENRAQKEPQLVAPREEVGTPAARPDNKLKADADLKQVPEQEADKALLDRLEKSSKVQSRATTNFPHGPAVLQNQVQNQIQNNANTDAFSYRQNQVAGGKAGEGDLNASVPPALAGNEPKRKEEAMKTAPAAAPPAPTAASADAGARKDAATETVTVTGAASQVEAKPVAKEKKALDEDAGRRQLGYVQNEAVMAQLRGRTAADLGETIILTPDPKVLWVATRDGALRRFENSGRPGVLQDLGPGIKALAGAAPDAKTCWVLGAGNLIFRTVDGGKHWAQVSTPIGADFRTIAATDSQHATVSDAAGTVKLTTGDGGATWKAAARP